jgi:hypothetical protein
VTGYTHAELSAAIDSERSILDPSVIGEGAQLAHLDTLAEINALHLEGNGLCAGCYGLVDVAGNFIGGCVRWPCPTENLVIDSLRKMGVL